MKQLYGPGFSVLLIVAIAACAPAPAPGQPGISAEVPQARAPIQRTLVILARGEPPTIAAKPLQAFSGSLAAPIRLFNAMLDYIDEREIGHPYLASALPELNTDTWQVFPDGTMQTRYQLKAGLKWHDGTPLTADDFVNGLLGPTHLGRKLPLRHSPGFELLRQELSWPDDGIVL